MSEAAIERTSTDYRNLSDRFSKLNTNFTKQYCSIYTVRLKKMRDLLDAKISEKWGDKYPVCRLHKLSVENYPKCIVIGTLFKDQKLKPSVLKQLAEANQLLPQPIVTHFTDETDTLYIEDELQRYQLLGVLNGPKLVTGITCALLGTDLTKGKFMVEDYTFADFRPQVERPLMVEDRYVVFISGLDLIHVEKNLLILQLFINWISGIAGNSCADIEVSKITRLIVAGNSMRNSTAKSKTTISMTSRGSEAPESLEAMKLFDSILLELSRVMEIDVMPGEHDPSNYIMPQKPMHHCMFPNSMAYKSLNLVSNPYECDVGGLRILGTSGQPVADVLRFSDIDDSLEVLENCLKWNHLAPTAPDTLGSFPFYESDPFILEECPHIFFAGNQETFSTKLCEGPGGQVVRLLCIPEFINTCTVCVVNLKNLDCTPLQFRVL